MGAWAAGAAGGRRSLVRDDTWGVEVAIMVFGELKTIQGGAIGKFRFLAWRVVARGARVVVDSTLPLVLCQATFFMGHAIGHIGS